MTFSLKSLGKYKYILLLIACAVVLLLLPAGGSDTGDGGSSAAESRLEYVLSGIEGVGPGERPLLGGRRGGRLRRRR